MEFQGIPRAEALEKLFAKWPAAPKSESVLLEDSCGRITAEPVYARLTLPVVRSSQADGIAVRSKDFAGGPPDTSSWTPGKEFVRADTGDDFDDAFDAVIFIENVQFNEKGGFSLPKDIKVSSGMHIRKRGGMVFEGELLLDKGLPIRSCDLGTLSMGGIRQVNVVKKPVIAFLPTGNELVPHGSEPQRGENIDSNSVMVKAMLKEMGAEPCMLPPVKDRPECIRQSLDKALETADAVIVNGGSSRGAEDFNARIIAERGMILCNGVKSAPGRPILIALINGKPVINLPGPMIAAYYGMDWCIRAIVCRALGIPRPERRTVKAVRNA
jgi:molybdopterin molybdotransferase/putative molybdopterin biosynthesis protein